MKRLPLALFLAVALPAPASAAVFGELPFRPVLDAASCVRSPGAPGEIARESSHSVEFLRAGASGLQPTGVALPDAFALLCPAVASAPTGAGVAAAVGIGDGEQTFVLDAAVRDPGGAWAKPQQVIATSEALTTFSVAVSDRGDAAVAATISTGGEHGPYRTIVARRAPGGAFAEPVTLATAKVNAAEPAVRVGLAAGGELIAAWTQSRGRAVSLNVAIAPPGGAFGPAQSLGRVASAGAPALGVAPDGRALLAFVAGGAVRVAERAPGGAFGAPVEVADANDPLAVEPELALRAGGAAALAWQGVAGRGVGVATRAGAGPFGPPLTLAEPGLGGIAGDLTAPAGVPVDIAFVDNLLFGGHVQVALAGPSAALTWPDEVTTGALEWRGVRAARVLLAGGHADIDLLGSPLRDADSAAPLALPDGTPAVAWADDLAGGSSGRLHIAVAGAAPVSRRAPRVRVGRPLHSVLRRSAPLRLPVSCSAACDVRLQLVGSGQDVRFSLPRAGTRRVRVEPLGRPIAPVRRGPVRLRLASGAPGAVHPSIRIVTVTLRRAR